MSIYNSPKADEFIYPETAIAQIANLVLPKANKRPLIGHELEVFVVHRDTGKPIDYKTHQYLLSQLHERLKTYGLYFGLGYEKDPASGEDIFTHLKGVNRHKKWLICGEPGCQIEFAPGPLENMHEVADATERFLSALTEIAATHGYAVAIPGLYPLCRGEDIPLSQRPRYIAYQDRINAVESGYGHDLSRGTCSLQVNFDTTPATWTESARTALLIQPFITALFANAAVFYGHTTQHVSHRAILWFEKWNEKPKPLRDLVADPDFSAHKFAAYALTQNVPIWVNADGDIPLPEGTKLIDLLTPETRPQQIDERPTRGDIINILGTLYGGIKFKPDGLIELRGADASYELRHALAALVTGIFYDGENLRQAHALVSTWGEAQRDHLAYHAPRQGLDAPFADGTLRDVALLLCEWSYEGLVRRELGEEEYLKPLLAIARGHVPTVAKAFFESTRGGNSILETFKQSFVPHPIYGGSAKRVANPSGRQHIPPPP